MVYIDPGIYRAGIEVSSGTTLRMRPGVYQLTGSPNLDLSAPISGDDAGVVVHAARSQSGKTHEITGNVDMKTDGTLCAPTAHVSYSGNRRAAITMLIAGTIDFNGNSRFQRNAHLTAVPIPSGFAGLGACRRRPGVALCGATALSPSRKPIPCSVPSPPASPSPWP